MKHLLPFYKTRTFRRAMIAVPAMLLVGILTFTVYAAFLSAGHRKGVAVANGHYFTSNVLMRMNSATPSNYICVDSTYDTQLTVQIRNYDAKMQPDPFDVTYKISFQLITNANTGSLYSYSVTYNGQKKVITEAKDTFEDLILTGSEMSSQPFQISFLRPDGSEPAPNEAATIQVIAVPTDPLVMTGYQIGANISLASSEGEFQVECGFDEALLQGDVTDFAGFLYHITTSGTLPDDEQPSVTLTWDGNLLELDEQSVYYGAVTDDSGQKTLTIPVQPGEYLSLAFFRADGWVAGTDLTSVITYTP